MKLNTAIPMMWMLVILLSCASAQYSGSNSGSGSGMPEVCSTGDIKLVDGDTEYEGRVEVCVGGAYGTVCDDFWTVSDARVVCRQLGLPWEGATQHSFSLFGQGNGDIVLDDVRCDGSEELLIDCPYDPNTADCAHFEDAGVTCAEGPDECNDGEIRLVGGNTDNEGRVEVCYLGQWGTVCDDGWNADSAYVTCQSLGIDGGSMPFDFGSGEGIIHIDDISCNGNENSLLNCTFTSDHNCIHAEDAGVQCGLPLECSLDGEIQLAGSDEPDQGRVEVCSYGIWGTVCDDFWGPDDAAVVCRELGLDYTGVIAYRRAYFGPGDGPILFDNVQCTGDEESIFDCAYTESHNCVHFEDAGVLCSNATCTEGDIRLVNGYSEYEGRVEICLNGLWGTVCDDFWSNNDAVVVCGQLGLPTNNSLAIGSAYFGPGTGPINVDNVFCTGSEDQLTDCFYSYFHNCEHSEDASVICMDTQSDCIDGQVRLVGGVNETEGRIEICFSNEWGTVCDNEWDYLGATVICRQLGFNTNFAVPVYSAGFGQGRDPILLGDVKCIGNEPSIFACDFTIDPSCTHSQDAGVQCGHANECSHGEVKLVGGDSDTEGRVEVCVGGYWGTVCDDGWTYQDAQVVCDQLGYPSEGAKALTFAHFGVGSGRINMDDVECEGDENLLLNCSYNSQHNCIHAEDAGVQCLEAECVDESIRLVGGLNKTEGRVEVCLGGRWGTVCDDLWGVSDARVVCRQLGYPWEGAEAYSFAEFGQGLGPIVLDNVDCDGDENSILDCPYDEDTSDCTHFEDAGVRCLESINECNDSDVRLVGGSNEFEGRVEVCVLGEWGTVCDDFWTDTDAIVVCNQLGYPSGGVQALRQAYFGQGSGNIHMDDVGCYGNESYLLSCKYEPNHNCLHSEDASVICGEAECDNGDVRLVNGGNEYQGRVEVCVTGVWGTVCDDFWSGLDAKVVCNQLGFSKEGALGFPNAYYGSGSGPIHLDDVQCGGGEGNLLQCNYQSNHNCDHSDDAGVRCLPLVAPTSSPTMILGSCGLAGFTDTEECCSRVTDTDCLGATGDCYCDASCYEFADCCDDIDDTVCLAPSATPNPSRGSCVEQDFNGCCSTDVYPSCQGTDDICYCDQACYGFGDCCYDIQNIGCYATANSPTMEPMSSVLFMPSTTSSGTTSLLQPSTTSSSSMGMSSNGITTLLSQTTPSTPPTISAPPTNTPITPSTIAPSTAAPPTTTTPSTTSAPPTISSVTASTAAPPTTSAPPTISSVTASTAAPPTTSAPLTTLTQQSTIALSTLAPSTVAPPTTSAPPTSTSSGMSSKISSAQTMSATPTTTPILEVPSSVQNLAIISISDSSVKFTWNAPVVHGGLKEYHLSVRKRTGEPVVSEIIQANNDLVQYTVNGVLVPYIAYTVSVTPLNANDDQGPATSIDFFTREGKPVEPPPNVEITRINSTAINVTWDLLSIESARGFVLRYLISFQSTDQGSMASQTFVNGSTSYKVLSGLETGKMYAVTVMAITSAGEGVASPLTYESGSGPPTDGGVVLNSTAYAVIAVIVVIGVLFLVGAIIGIACVIQKKLRGKYRVNETGDGFENDQEMLHYSDGKDVKGKTDKDPVSKYQKFEDEKEDELFAL